MSGSGEEYTEIAQADNWREGSTYTWHSSTLSVIVKCEQTQNVWMAAAGDGFTLDDCTNCHRNQFSGLMLAEDDS